MLFFFDVRKILQRFLEFSPIDSGLLCGFCKLFYSNTSMLGIAGQDSTQAGIRATL
jgi:hypothetical protein